ncbi:MAG: hypothetical protein JOY66_24320 [Acetobacteraceae bacterium]|nr:hypothetical protein [Acetobacteraceae bacterium]
MAAEKANALFQAALLRDSPPVIRELVQQKRLSVTAGHYDLATGRVTLLS